VETEPNPSRPHNVSGVPSSRDASPKLSVPADAAVVVVAVPEKKEEEEEEEEEEGCTSFGRSALHQS
jgi:hypothetical protein